MSDNIYTAEQLIEFEKQQSAINASLEEIQKIAEILQQKQAEMERMRHALNEAKKTEDMKRAEEAARIEAKRMQEQVQYEAKKEAFSRTTKKAVGSHYLGRERKFAQTNVIDNELFNWLWGRAYAAEREIADLKRFINRLVPITKVKRVEDHLYWPTHLLVNKLEMLQDVAIKKRVENERVKKMSADSSLFGVRNAVIDSIILARACKIALRQAARMQIAEVLARQMRDNFADEIGG